MTQGFHVIDPRAGGAIDPGDWTARVSRMRAALRAAGVVPGDRVLAWLPRGWEEGAAWRATQDLGGVWVSVPRRLAPEQVAALLADAEPKVAVCGPGERPRLGAGPWIEIPGPDAPQDVALVASPPARGLAALCYTSGSTGRPKGVMVSHENLAGAVARLEAYLRHGPDDRLLALMPLSSPWGLLQWLMAERAAAAIVLPPIAMAAELARVIRAAGVTGLAALPPTWVQLVDYLDARRETLPSLRYVTTSGGVIPRRILDRFDAVFPAAEVWMTYGLTEAFRTTVLPAAEFARRKGSLGKDCPGVEIAIVRPDGTAAATDETGELVHVGDCVTMGYWRQPEATRQSFAVRPEHRPLLGDRPVHYSGDRVRRDAEGYLWFEGRDDELIKSGGYRISPAEIEAALLAVPGVVHAVAGGIPDETLGQRIAVALEVEGEGGADLEAIRAALRRSLASHQQPHAIRVWPGTMPLNPHGKINRREVLSWLTGPDVP
jgi:acyl-CoA synthetase (AMP-forming)/AMP-acid ligase II